MTCQLMPSQALRPLLQAAGAGESCQYARIQSKEARHQVENQAAVLALMIRLFEISDSRSFDVNSLLQAGRGLIRVRMLDS